MEISVAHEVIDTHIHASQYSNCGLFGNTTLLEWLNTYTFPTEASLSEISEARRVYNRCIARTLAHGTTTASYFATISVAATNLLADLCLALGQRALVGRVCMDTNAPTWYRDESVEDAIRDTRACIDHCRSIDPHGDLVRPVLTPRFAVSCTAELLHALSALQQETCLPVQTHMSENQAEIHVVRQAFPECPNYASVYEQAGLLGPQTILAHVVHVDEAEMALIKKSDSKVSHCPVSNTCLASGQARIRDLLDRGIDVGLGTDVSGGYSASILEAARHAILVSRHVAMAGDERASLSVAEVLYLATRGGAEVLGLADIVGAWQVGMHWDAQRIRLGRADDPSTELPVDIFGAETWDERVRKWLFGGDDRNTVAVWVKGRLVHERATR